MYSSYQLPIQSTPQPPPPPVRRHRSARYYAHQLRESFATRVSKLACSIFLFLLFLIGMITFILWLSLRPHRPRFHIRDFSIPAITQANGFQNAQINFNVTARNPNANIGVYYDSTHVSVWYDDQSVGATPVLFPFYQGPKNTTIIDGSLSGATLTVDNQRWQEFVSDRSQGRVVFKLEVTSVIRFKISSWNSKRHTMHANCDAEVGSDGSILETSKNKRCPVYFS
ncbi:OLC1v1021897C1 [Oldenlandia corymbosa var. corymbosa]|uniref:OLC1v1021897C1 n=1 Tax=Oldenlandia corymbosa var. corymbosa TaxID=529605 RepID=A0AAV1BWQ1_OLDCO|nr:OLC1v1021897C1 [Oldenlandia corymbosa var. corymbosa]